MNNLLNEQEIKIMNALSGLHADFAALPVLHPADLQDFTAAARAIENLVLSRPVVRALKIAELQAQQPPQAQNSALE